ncbi:radical SAM protein [bacterium]|nr:radical SAM protein [bacterium]MBU1063753.1 radical SAM protein [bacterium]MBU1635594.1 radical SAM protein [bacterium]MBU1873752.1 radical SAM protein [bacterium]
MPTISSTELFKRSQELNTLLSPCELCPRRCLAHRREGQSGYCQLGDTVLLSSVLPHHGEEPPISGIHGSGTVFLSGCNAGCIFCQNYQISHLKMGQIISIEELSQQYLHLQKTGCHNINWVTPTPHLPFLVEALADAVSKGLTIPLVYNTNGYDRHEILQLLDGIVDIYLPDMKYGSDHWAEQFSKLPDYTAISVAAIREMYRQVGTLQLDKNHIAQRGLLIRHLVLPEGTAGSSKVFQSIAAIDPQIPVSIMAQYHPCYQAISHPILGKRITLKEYQQVLEVFEESGLGNAYLQDITDLEQQDTFFPDFEKPADRIFKK